jgi:hypothetical protein
MNLNKIKQWFIGQSFDINLVDKLTKNNQKLYAEQQKALLDLKRMKVSNNRLIGACNELERQNEGKRIALIFITTLLIVSLVGNAIQYFS